MGEISGTSKIIHGRTAIGDGMIGIGVILLGGERGWVTLWRIP